MSLSLAHFTPRHGSLKGRSTHPAFQPTPMLRTSSLAHDPLARQAPNPSSYRFASGDDAEDEAGRRTRFSKGAAGREDLPYRVELWNDAKTGVEQILAVTANSSIGYAAFYAATREHPERYITLRHKNSVVSRWNGPDH